ncbi:uncharacterized protein LOC123550023 isoform X2 [Mercenaria mercenaria]|nr:uncharacterized protein LOC123550023 isoform X2 [Mercenaria mercenaria]XP_053402180.1 uncharacterized protein LOC123550023 isoform X2 [Mercenaria mercenaria]
MEQLKHELFSSDGGKQHGVVLVAEMGYGKSAFISKLLCPGSSESAISIQKHIVAFHVCKFDVRSTHCSERFIRRLIGFFAMKSAEYGNIISMLPEAHIVFNRDSCEKEPDACFDQGITIPIKQLSNHMNTPWIVVIDAVDECENTGSNPILELLSRRMKHLPKWLKFLVTSRNITSLTLLRKMKIEQLYSNDSRNKNDIKAFIQESFPVNTNPDMINTLVDKSEGNFVYIIQALKWILDKKDYDNVPDFPSDLGDVYEINFDRQFVDAEAYRIPKLILEIVCSTINPVTKVDIYTILRSSNIFPDKKDFDRHFASLNFFLRTGESVRVPHQALYRWLIDEQNESYGISLQAGHALISKYMFSTLTGNNTKDIVDLAIHVANSADSTLRKMFVSSTFSDIGGSNSVPLVHKLIWKTSCIKALELLLHHYPDVNVINEGNVTPAFVAAAKGHTDQLKLLHGKGANLGFTVRGHFLISPYMVFSKIEMMKHHYYAGYGLLHIAAQHGHSSIVKYILAHNRTLIYEKNALGLHAGQIACESGNLEVIKILHSFEPKLFGYKCMFYASKQNHKTILKWLVQNGIEYKCISDNESLEAAHSIEQLNVVQILEYSSLLFPNDIYSLDRINSFDIWWIVFKTTPLAVAIQTGSMDAARYLIETFPKSLDCYDAYGYTPALASVFYSRTELYPLLSKNFETDKCGKIPDHLLDLKILKHMRLYEMAHKCPEGGSLAHIVALYALDKEIFWFYLRERLQINWNEPDYSGNFPIHYAIANNYLLFIMLFEQGTITHDNRYSYREITAANGSTVYHIAAMSDQSLSMHHLTGSFKKPIPELKDEHGRGITHYVVLRQFLNIVGKHETDAQFISALFLRYLVETAKHNIKTYDYFGRNILHYGFRNGYISVVKYLKYEYQSIFDLLLSQRDNEGLTPIDFALKDYQRSSSIIVLPKKCSYFDVYFTFCLNDSEYSNVMSSWELGLSYLIQTASKGQYYNFIEPNLKYIMEKSPYLLTAVLVYHNYMTLDHLKHQLIVINEHDLSVWTQLTVARHKPEAFRVCREPLTKSPLHFSLLTVNYKHSVFSFENHDVNNFLHMVYGYPINSTLFGCPDENGYNIFHYSLIGGNIQTARILMSKNIRMINDHVTLKDIFLMAMSSRIKTDHENFIKCSENVYYRAQETCIDTFLVEFLKKSKLKIKFSDFCQSGSQELSLVHLLAANGMIRTLETVSKIFGQKSLNCRNKDDFTPLYFGKLFSQDSVVTLIGDNENSVLPRVEAEEWYIWSLLNKFPQINISEPLFYFAHSLCLNKFSYRYVLYRQKCVVKLLKKTFLPISGIGDYSYHQAMVSVNHVASKMPTILFCLRVLESMYFHHNMSTIICRSPFLNIANCYRTFNELVSNLKVGIFSDKRKLFRRMRENIYPVYKQFKKIYIRVKAYCFEYFNYELLKRKLYRLIVSLNKLCFFLNKIVSRAAISFYVQGGKSVKISVPNSFTFLQLRMKNLKFIVDEGIRFLAEPAPLVAVNGGSLYKYKYISIIKTTLAYKRLRKNLIVDKFGLKSVFDISKFRTTKTYVKENVMLKEPFKDLE